MAYQPEGRHRGAAGVGVRAYHGSLVVPNGFPPVKASSQRR